MSLLLSFSNKLINKPTEPLHVDQLIPTSWSIGHKNTLKFPNQNQWEQYSQTQFEKWRNSASTLTSSRFPTLRLSILDQRQCSGPHECKEVVDISGVFLSFAAPLTNEPCIQKLKNFFDAIKWNLKTLTAKTFFLWRTVTAAADHVRWRPEITTVRMMRGARLPAYTWPHCVKMAGFYIPRKVKKQTPSPDSGVSSHMATPPSGTWMQS